MIFESRSWVSWAACALLLALAGCDNNSNPAAPGMLAVSCNANPSAGTAPLNVAFAVAVSGAQGSFQVSVSYGDGTSGRDASSSHVYPSPGTYTATFNVTSGSQSTSCTANVNVSAPPAPPPPPVTANQPPDAVFRTTPKPGRNGRISGPAPFEVQFNMCRTFDPDHDPLRFTMDFDGDGIDDVSGSTGGDCRRSFEYGPGVYAARLCVTDLVGPGAQERHPPQCEVFIVEAG
jgi:PKD domain